VRGGVLKLPCIMTACILIQRVVVHGQGDIACMVLTGKGHLVCMVASSHLHRIRTVNQVSYGPAFSSSNWWWSRELPAKTTSAPHCHLHVSRRVRRLQNRGTYSVPAVDEHWATSGCQYDWCRVCSRSKNDILTLHTVITSKSCLISDDERGDTSEVNGRRPARM
jgi:hypothetical protein